MRCADWQRRIAADDGDAEDVAEHLECCDECREFAADLALNTAALQAIDVGPAAYAELRSRVMRSIGLQKRFPWMWAGAAAAAVAAACVASVWLTTPLRAPETGGPQALTYTIPAPPSAFVRTSPVTHSVQRHRMRTVEGESHLAAIKLLTDDPNVVIIWMVEENKRGGL